MVRPNTPNTTRAVKDVIGKLACHVLPVPTPEVVSGSGSLSEMSEVLKKLGVKKPLIVTDEVLVKLGAVQPCMDSLVSAGMQYELFDSVTPNPPSELVEEGYALYKKASCDCIIAFGGGSPMDCAKIIGAKVANPRPVKSYQGMLNCEAYGLYGRLPPLVAVPTTAGTGSETTVAAIITLKEERMKINIVDPGLVPKVAVLDPQVLKNLPKPITAATGMDALTHAVESFLGAWQPKAVKKYSLMSVEKIFKYLKTSYHEPENMEAREAMLNAAFEGGAAITRGSVGYVHAIAHQFGGMFHTPHGVANAMVLPHILDFYIRDEKYDTEQFFELAKAAGLASHYQEYSPSEKRQLAKLLVQRVREMNEEMCIPQNVPAMKAIDVSDVAKRALAENHGELNGGFLKAPLAHLLDIGYPVPKYMNLAECEAIVAQCLPAEERQKWESSRGQQRSKL